MPTNKYLHLRLLSFFVLLQSFAWSAAVPQTSKLSNNPAPSFIELTKYSNKQIQKIIGRKLILKEKAALFAYRTLRRTDDVKRANSYARTGLILTVVGLLVLPVLPTIPGIILCISALSSEKKSPGTLTRKNKSLAIVGIILGAVSLLLLAVIIVAITAFEVQ